MANSDASWDTNAEPKKQPGVSEAELDAWQKSNGVQLPAVLREVLSVQNGGLMSNSDTTLFGLSDIVRPDEEVFYDLEDDEDLCAKFEDRGLVFAFAEEVNDGLPMYLLNFNANGPTGEPSVHHYYRDMGDIEPEAATVSAFFAAKQATDSECAVDWTETEKLAPVLFREKCEIPDLEGGKRIVESVVGRLEGRLCVFKHEVWGDEESYLKLEVDEPLDPEELEIETIGSKPRVYSLRLISLDEDDFDDDDDDDELDDDFDLDDLDWDAEDDDEDGEDAEDDEGEDPDENRTESKRMKDGTWKNASVGALDDIESLSRENLEKLRLELLGEEGAKVARSAEALQAKAGQLAEQLAQKMESMTPEERLKAGVAIAKELGAFGDNPLESLSGLLEGLDEEEEEDEEPG